MSIRALKKWALLLTFWVALQTRYLRADQTITGNLTVTGTSDIQGNTLSLGTRTDTSDPGALTLYTDGTISTLEFDASRSASIWKWQQNGGATLQLQMSLDNNNALVLYDQSSTPTAKVTLNPLGTSIFANSLTVNGTDNEMPNQTLVNSNSVLTEGLADSRYLSFNGTSLAMFPYSSATGANSMALGNISTASGDNSVAMGKWTTASGFGSIAIGKGATASGYASTSLGSSLASGFGSTAMGYGSTASGAVATAMGGGGTTASGDGSTAMGGGSIASGDYSSAMGSNVTASGYASTALGRYALASGNYSMAMGLHTTANGNMSFAVGAYSTGSGDFSTAMGRSSSATGYIATASGYSTLASGSSSTAMGSETIASNYYSIAMGGNTTASGSSSTAMGSWSIASGNSSTAMGYGSTASGDSSTAMGNQTTASAFAELTLGQYNVGGFATGGNTSWVATDPLLELGNGTDASHPSDALLVDKSGNATFQGNVNAASVSTTGAVTASTFVMTTQAGDIPMYQGN